MATKAMKAEMQKMASEKSVQEGALKVATKLDIFIIRASGELANVLPKKVSK